MSIAFDQTGSHVLRIRNVRDLEVAGLEAVARGGAGQEDVLGDRPLRPTDLPAAELAHAVDVGALERHDVRGRADHGVDGHRRVRNALVQTDQERRGRGRVDVDRPGDHRVAALLAEEELSRLDLEPCLLEVALPDGDDVGGAHDRGMNAEPNLEGPGLRRRRSGQHENQSKGREHG
jgi:hypothetical protein